MRIRSYTTPPDMKELEAKIQQLNKEKEEAIAHQNFERAAQIRDEERAIRADMEAQRKAWEDRRSTAQRQVGAEEVAQIVASWTHIPVTQLTQDESDRLLHLEETLHQADQLRKKTAEEALVAKYGESVDKSLAARIMGVTRSTVYAMIADGRVESAGAGKRVSVRSIARYLS